MHTSEALGQDGKMVVTATASLDACGTVMGQAIRFQTKSPFIAKAAMVEIIVVRELFWIQWTSELQ
jgi:hypothetical protein